MGIAACAGVAPTQHEEKRRCARARGTPILHLMAAVAGCTRCTTEAEARSVTPYAYLAACDRQYSHTFKHSSHTHMLRSARGRTRAPYFVHKLGVTERTSSSPLSEPA